MDRPECKISCPYLTEAQACTEDKALVIDHIMDLIRPLVSYAEGLTTGNVAHRRHILVSTLRRVMAEGRTK